MDASPPVAPAPRKPAGRPRAHPTRAARAASCLLVALAPLVSACERGVVVRIVDGVEVSHRFLPAKAYAAYARGVYAETQGRLDDAVTAFVAAADADPDGVEPRTRLGAVACRLGRKGDAERAFAEAERRDATFEPLWRERALCDLSRSDLKAALRDSARAEQMDPEREETILLHANVLERTGDGAGALREIVGLTTRHPSPTAWRRQLGVAERLGDVPAARLAKVALSLHPDAEAPPKPSPAQRLDLVDHLLDAKDFAGAERAGRAAKLSPAEVAVRAAAMGRAAVARREAARILGAEPSSGDALIAALAASDLERDPTALSALCDRARSARLETPSPLAAQLLVEVLARRVGPEVDLAAPVPDPSDPLAVAIAARIDRLRPSARRASTPRPSAPRPSAPGPSTPGPSTPGDAAPSR